MLTRTFHSRTSGLLVTVMAVTALLGLATTVVGTEMQLPPAERSVLSNGMVVLVMNDSRLPLVNFQMAVWGGSASDPAGVEGVADLTATLLRKGAGDRSAVEVAETVEFMGGSLNSSARPDFTLLTAEFLAKDTEKGLGILGDVLLRPNFDEEEFEREKANVLGRLEQVPDDPYDLADREFGMYLLGEHPYAHPTNGTLTSVRAIERADVIKYHKVSYRPQRAVLAIVGDVDPAEMLSAVRNVFGGWVPEGEAPSPATAPIGKTGRRILLINKPDATQTQIRIGNLALSRADEDYVPLTVANTLFGGGFTSRLIDEIRVNRGLSYSPHSRLYSMAGGGIFVIKEYTRNEQAMETIEVTMDLVENLRNEPIPEEEVAKTKNYVTGLFPLRLERPESMARQMLEVELYQLGAEYLDEFSKKVGEVTAERLSQVVNRYVGPDDLTFVIVGVADQLEEPLSKFGEVEVREISGATD
jgi:zinc protease